jgi:F-type H+-transporting ATPase subunit gamma
MVQVPKIYKLFPVPQEISVDREPLDFILEPNPAELAKELYYHYLEVRFFQILVDSEVGELSARLMIMKEAVDNSKELIDQLKISVNKERQALITRELIEIISSVEALRREYE